MKTDKQLRDIAYRIATGNHLTKTFSYAQFQKCNVMNHLWEPLQDWGKDLVEDHISQIAEEIYSTLKDTHETH